MSLWNDLTLPNPSADFCAYDVEDSRSFDAIYSLTTTLSEASCRIGHENVLWDELKIFYGIAKRLSFKVPSSKFLLMFKQTNRCLRNIFTANLSAAYLSFAKTLLSGLEEGSQVAVLPSYQQLEYLLVQTQGVAVLLCQAMEYCNASFENLLLHLNVGHLVQSLVIAASSLARISLFLKAFLLELCPIYDNLMARGNVLKTGSWHWPVDPDLPEDLLDWLGPRAQDLLRVKDTLEGKPSLLDNIFKSEESNPYTENNVEEATMNEDLIVTSIIATGSMDLGEVVSRDEIMMANGDKDERDSAKEKSTKNPERILEKSELNLEDRESVLHYLKNAKTLNSLKQIFKILLLASHTREKYPRVKSPREVKTIFDKLKAHIILFKQIEKSQRSLKKKQIKEIFLLAKKKLWKQVEFKVHNEGKKKNNTSDLKRKNIVRICDLKPAKSFKTFLKLYKQLMRIAVEHKNKKLYINLKKLYDDGYSKALLVKNSGDSSTFKKIVLRASKKMLSSVDEMS